MATFHLLADSSRAMYSISATLVSLFRACLVDPISVLLGRLVGMDFLPQDARLGEPYIACPPLRKGGAGSWVLLRYGPKDSPNNTTVAPSLAKRGRAGGGGILQELRAAQFSPNPHHKPTSMMKIRHGSRMHKRPIR